jgi:hypothetical protein
LISERIVELVAKAKARDLNYHSPNFLNYYTLDLSTRIEAQQIREKLKACEAVEKTYLEINPICPPSSRTIRKSLNIQQSYLGPSPTGIDVKYAWQFKGGDGCSTVKFIDIEQGWIENHETVPIHTLPDTGINHPFLKDHGIGVLGIINMQNNDQGGIGTTPKANGYVLSQWRPNGRLNMADALLTSINHLDFGDVLLIQSQAYDPLSKMALPVEIFDMNFQLMQLATALGIILVEPAGNGNNISGLDLDLYTDNCGFNALNRSDKNFKDSGAIIVAAASSNIPHQKMPFSNYGSRVDCYAWGENVTTAGSFPEQSGEATDTYTKCFSGTSSASAIITGAVISLQSIAEANLGCKLSPSEMRKVLCNPLIGTSSINGHHIDKIGVMPDLKRIIVDSLKLRLQPIKVNQQQNRKELLKVKNTSTI